MGPLSVAAGTAIPWFFFPELIIVGTVGAVGVSGYVLTDAVQTSYNMLTD